MCLSFIIIFLECSKSMAKCIIQLINGHNFHTITYAINKDNDFTTVNDKDRI